MSAVATVVLGDDNAVFLDALASVLAQHGHYAAAVTSSAGQLVESVRSVRPEVCLLNRPPGADDSADVIGQVIAASARTRVLMLSGGSEHAAAQLALDAGASGYVHRSRGVAALICAVGGVLAGQVVVNLPAAANTRRSACGSDAERLAARLTLRERECLALLVEGLDTASMVVKLGVSRTTVRTHVQAVLSKLGVHSRLEAASFAVRSGLLDACDADALTRGRRAAGPVYAGRARGGSPVRALPGGGRVAARRPAEQRRAFSTGHAPLPRPRPAPSSETPFRAAERAS